MAEPDDRKAILERFEKRFNDAGWTTVWATEGAVLVSAPMPGFERKETSTDIDQLSLPEKPQTTE